jgi:hypothetical protein
VKVPIERGWWIEPGQILAGPFPGGSGDAGLAALLDAGIRVVVNLQELGELGRGGIAFPDYRPRLHELAAERGAAVVVHRLPIPDMGVPTPERMQEILDVLARSRAAGAGVYLHCWGGHGRSSTVAACWHVSAGATAEEAIGRVRSSREHDPYLAGMRVPQSLAQETFIAGWGTNR